MASNRKYDDYILDSVRRWRIEGRPTTQITDDVGSLIGETVTWEAISRAVRRYGGWGESDHYLAEKLAESELPQTHQTAGWFYRKQAQFVYESRERLKVAVIPDTQIKPGQSVVHIIALARYLAAKKPDVIVMLGDWYDMPSLSSYDENKLPMEGRRYLADIAAGNEALELFESTLAEHAGEDYKPRKVFLLGNHEERIQRFVNDHPKLEGVIGYHNFVFPEYGWEMHEFMAEVEIGGVLFSHLLPKNKQGKVTPSSRRMGSRSAAYQLDVYKQSCIAGHRQGLELAGPIYLGKRRMRSAIAGSYYTHDESYLGPAGNDYWRGMLMLHEVHEGSFDLMEVSLDYLVSRYA